jgi:hypothetical protein
VVLCRCKTWSLALREKLGLNVFKNEVLRRIFGRKRDEVIGEWRKLHNEEFLGLCSSPSYKGQKVGGWIIMRWILER